LPDLTTDHFYSDSKSSVIDPKKWQGMMDNTFYVKATGIAQDTPLPPGPEAV
jgi:hypothetical protein